MCRLIVSQSRSRPKDGVVFFRDPLDKHPHDVDISMLMRLCDVHEVPLATNYKSAHILVKYFKNK